MSPSGQAYNEYGCQPRHLPTFAYSYCRDWKGRTKNSARLTTTVETIAASSMSIGDENCMFEDVVDVWLVKKLSTVIRMAVEVIILV